MYLCDLCLKLLSEWYEAKESVEFMEQLLNAKRSLIAGKIVMILKEAIKTFLWVNENVCKPLRPHKSSSWTEQQSNNFEIYMGFLDKLEDFTTRLDVLSKSILGETALWDALNTDEEDLEEIPIKNLKQLVEKWETRIKVLPEWESAMNRFLAEWEGHHMPEIKKHCGTDGLLMDSLSQEDKSKSL